MLESDSISLLARCEPRMIRKAVPHVALPDGRRLSYAEWGDPSGLPVLLFHGLPGSRLQCHPEAATNGGVRMITIDRPGFGESDADPGRTLLDWPHDVARLADHLDLDRFAVCAWSGGGPFGLACAQVLPERVSRLILASSVGPLEDQRALSGMILSNRLLFQCARYVPYAVDLPVSVIGAIASWNLEWRLDSLAEQLSPADRALLERKDFRDMLLTDMAEAIRQGLGATSRELRLLAQPWDLRLEEIRIPVTILHGTEDLITPLAMGTNLARRVPDARFERWAGEGHFLAFRHWRHVLHLAID